VAFCQELCRHTKDRWARKPFILSIWQRRDIIEPLFGEVVWDEERDSYVRLFRIAWIEVARKNGGMGTRAQPLMVAATAGDDPASFARSEHDECIRIIDDPQRAAHRFAYIRNVPEDADPWDEKHWAVGQPRAPPRQVRPPRWPSPDGGAGAETCSVGPHGRAMS
jgi:phage terminase large subunit-like protein